MTREHQPTAVHLLVTTTLPGEAQAARIAEAAVRERLAACAQVEGPIHSTYHWQGALEHATEWYCHLKTTRDRYQALESLIRSLHPYEVPEVVATPIVAGHEAYLRWIDQEVRSEDG
ncbi:MAG TPA: divalent-cation tolerance protein CutA [Gemmatimonadales bacterium]|jgi:periplasmic divalent cation tolerance protein